MKLNIGIIEPTPEEKTRRLVEVEVKKVQQEKETRQQATLDDLTRKRVDNKLTLNDIYDLQMLLLEKLK